jgi:hypothetical protein
MAVENPGRPDREYHHVRVRDAQVYVCNRGYRSHGDQDVDRGC